MTDQVPQQDGTLDSAAQHIPDTAIDVFMRDDAGRFAAKEQPAAIKEAAEDLKAQPQGDNAKPKTEAAAEEEDDYLEFVEEDGKEPQRLKVSEVWDGYRKAKEYETELTKIRQQPIIPQEIETAIVETTKAREQYMQGLKRMVAMNQPSPPSLELVDPNSPHYNPEAYHQGVRAYQVAVQRHEQAQAHLQELEQQQKNETEAVRAARWQRERAVLEQKWPEVFQKEAQSQIRSDLLKEYGIDDAFLSSDLTLDHRIYLLAKDALAYRKSQAKAAEAVKVVRSKPKLIRGSARDQQSPNRRAANDARARLSQSGSIDDAAAALDGLI